MPGQARDMTEVGKSIPDTDWYVRRLYDFARNLGASVIGAQYSRSVSYTHLTLPTTPYV